MDQVLNIPNLRHLRMIQMIGKLGGVNGAARQLSTSQPAVTQALGNFEAALGTPLFERSVSGSFPTAFGESYLLRIDRFFEILDGAVGQVLKQTTATPNLGSTQADLLITNTQLRSFVANCEVGRLREIAKSFGLTTTSLVRSARSLERALGATLFDRTADGPKPNKTGQMLAREFGRAIREIELARHELHIALGSESAPLLVGVPPMPGSHDLVMATVQFMAANPIVDIQFVAGGYLKLINDLSHGRIDMMFGILRLPSWGDDLEEEVLYCDTSCIVVRSDHPLTKMDRVTPRDLARYKWLVPPANTPRRDRIDRIFAGHGVSPRYSLQTASLSLGKAFLLGSDAISVMARSEVQREIDLELITAIPFAVPEIEQPKGITTRVGWLPTKSHDAFIECLRQTCV